MLRMDYGVVHQKKQLLAPWGFFSLFLLRKYTNLEPFACALVASN